MMKIWWLAIRPQTLTAAAVPVAVGSALAARVGSFRAGPAFAALAGALLLQIGTNLANDADDFERGADTAARLGPLRVTQSGLLSARVVRRAAWLSFAAAGFFGIYLAYVAGWRIVALGLASIAAGWAYTGGPWPLGYNGLGDLFVMAFFGLAAVAGTYYVQAGETTRLVWLAALPVGALATAILVVNNTRDADTDRTAGKRTIAVRFGRSAARAEYVALLVLAYAVPAFLWQAERLSAWSLLPALTVPAAAMLVRDFLGARDGATYNRALVATARLHAAFGLLLAFGLLG
jgi:1,4-dihydroxy-2-naphthoate octaprenyltransferase